MTIPHKQVMDIAQQRCFNHQQREAVARCPSCHRFFCRECITEHNDQVICVSCLQTMLTPKRHHRNFFHHSRMIIQSLVAILLLWLLFFSVGQALLRIPSSFHEGTLWNEWWD